MKLTDEQVEVAAKAMVEAWDKSNPGRRTEATVSPVWSSLLKDYARAAAPHLQMPWELPTEIEAVKCRTGYINLVDLRDSLANFVGIRNAALTPEPVDPRIAIIEEALRNDLYIDRKECARRVISALDGAKKYEWSMVGRRWIRSPVK